MQDDYAKLLGPALRRVRLAQGWTQKQLAAALRLKGRKVDQQAISKMEQGKRQIFAAEWIHIKEVLGVSYDELFPPVTPEILAEEEKIEPGEDGD